MLPGSLPLITGAMPGTGGVIKSQPEDFDVEEVPAYEPEGEGDHVYVWIEKRGMTTFDAVRALAGAVGVDERGCGTAGLKDRHAVTRQRISLPPPTAPAQLEALSLPGLRILSVARHRNKLKTGHLRGNRFRVRVRQTRVDGEVAAARAGDILAALAVSPGSPNWFGEQRFGRDGDNARTGAAILRGERSAGGPRGRRLRLAISAAQSELFNRYLARRVADDTYRQVLGGEVLKRTDSGGVFVSDDTVADSERLARGEVVQTGPMFGVKMRRPAEGSAAAALEQEIMEGSSLTLENFARYARLAPGTRRPIAVAIEGASVNPMGTDEIEVAFTLPSGAYATVVLREIIKPAADSDGQKTHL